MDKINSIILRQLKMKKIGSEINIVHSPQKDIPIVYFYDELDYFANECLFDGCSIEEIIILLHSFCSISYCNLFSWQVCCELSKLLSKYGKLIGKEAENFIFSDKHNNFREVSLHLSYFSTDLKWEEWCLKCLNICEEDFRDGVFLACYHLNTINIYLSLIKHFSEWIEKDLDWGKGTGESLALEKFLIQWNKNPNYNMHLNLQRIFLSKYSASGSNNHSEHK